MHEGTCWAAACNASAQTRILCDCSTAMAQGPVLTSRPL